MTDHASVACGDRFGNFTLLRIPADISDEAEIDPSGVGMIWEHKDMSGSPNKLEVISAFHVGDVICGMAFSVGQTCLVYGTVGGQIGAFIPFQRDWNVSLCKRLEAAMAKRVFSFDRHWELYRSYYLPKRNVIDGDLLLLFLKLGHEDRETVARDAGASVVEISRLLVSFNAYS
jgi:splicing factor 3B subunit 3